MKQAVQFGAGNIGRGFMGHLFWEADYRTIFIEKNIEIVKLINTRKKYPLKLLDAYTRKEIDLIIDNIPATKFITKMGEYTAWELTATQEPNSKNYYFEFFNPIYVLSNDVELDNLLEIFDKIFSSFKFLK